MNFTRPTPFSTPLEQAPQQPEPHNEFPYTAYYLSQKLNVPETQIVRIANLLGVMAHEDLETGNLFFSATDVTRIRQAIEKEARGERIQPVINRQTSPTTNKTYATQPTTQQQRPQLTPPQQIPPQQQRQPMQRQQNLMTSTDVSVLADAVNNMRDRLMGDVTYLLNEKLSGLDDMVIELVRSKSSIQLLQKQIQELENDLALAKAELNCYKPAAFGLYKKVR